jgi:hypothetical protein
MAAPVPVPEAEPLRGDDSNATAPYVPADEVGVDETTP